MRYHSLMDIVIPYKNSASNGLELRYTLRGIEKYFPDLGNVFIIGDFPDFLQNVIHIETCETRERHHKQWNICNTFLVACDDKRVSDDFAWISDDEFLIKPYQPDYNYCATLDQSISLFTEHQSYRNTLINTRNVLNGGFDYGHGPMVLNKWLFIKAMGCVNWNIPWGYVIKSLYCGFNSITGSRYPDLKIKEPLPYKAIGSLISDRPFFSIDDRGLNDNMKLLLHSLYPNKSQYEND